ncbi:hypothetical protein ROHU_030006 [Labeo rohita]|uniref:Uncharacterized protein n=1 Tax=Labeo rohita TaxID=84645 RepID=A0A498LSP7_LABRO|nr:hypothetical protein ROHU_030006 [Labeo rohita]
MVVAFKQITAEEETNSDSKDSPVVENDSDSETDDNLGYNIVLFGAVDGYSRKDIEEPDIDWDVAADYGEDVDGVIVVPEFECPLNEQQLVELQVLIEENGDTDTRDLYLLCHEYVLQALSGV